MRRRVGIIVFFVILFVSFISVWNYSYLKGQTEASIPVEVAEPTPVIPSESGVFERSDLALDYKNMPEDKEHQRSISGYYSNRAFSGAPPTIPHPVLDERSMGGLNCLKCHQNGGFVSKFEAYAPVTPHPDLVNCRQCHVPKKTEDLFVGSGFERLDPPTVGDNNALEGSPPVIPHRIQMRENCLACHGGPSAPIEIRVSHPERINCRQCHVPKESEVENVFHRKGYNE